VAAKRDQNLDALLAEARKHVAGHPRPAVASWVRKWVPRLTAAGAAALVDFLSGDAPAVPFLPASTGLGDASPPPPRSFLLFYSPVLLVLASCLAGSSCPYWHALEAWRGLATPSASSQGDAPCHAWCAGPGRCCQAVATTLSW
jgi:hypothetical protein